jgi:NADPH:quinone reductase-like Zn-dependent oxidoreductase/acyl transferase domain-containing protein/NAD(P)-dependent dehydrogenase (short-subunit alcohol dehydrogenase family)
MWTLLQELTQNCEPEHMRRPEFSQPLVTALQLSILAVLNDWGVQPSMSLGHSSGEIAAAAAAGLLTPEEAIKVAYFRGQASLVVPSRNFGMLAVGLGQVDVEAYLLTFPAVKIACINSPNSVTLSGRVDELQLLEALLKNDGHFARLLQVDLAYHSEYMSGIAAHYLDMVKENCPQLGSSRTSSGVQFFSTVIGAQMVNGVDAEYWYCNMICPVQFSQGLECMIEQGGADYLVELGPSAALAGPIKQCTATLPNRIDYYATLARGEDSVKPLYDLAGRMFLSGASIDLTKVNKSTNGDLPKVIIDMPNYQWNHSVKYWHENLSSQDWRYRKFPIHDLLGSKVLGTAWQNPSFRCILRLKNLPWLRDHKVRDCKHLRNPNTCSQIQVGSDIIFPAAGYAAMATEAMFQTSKSLGMLPDVNVVSRASYRLRNTRFLRALVLEEDNPHHVYLFLNPSLGPKDTWYHFSIQTLRDGTWTEHCNGLVRTLATVSEQAANADHLRPLEYPTPARAWYKALHNVGFNFGPAFQNLLEIEAIPSKRASRVRSTWSFSGQTDTQSKYAVHPAVIDSFFQAGVPPLYEGYRTGIDRVFVPRIIDDMIILARTRLPETSLTLTGCEWTRIGRSDSIRNYASNAAVYDENGGHLLFKVAGLRYIELETNAAGHKPHQYVQLAWKPDVTLLSDVRLDSLPLVPSETDTLEWELDLPGCAVEMLILALHKRPNMSIAEIDLRATEHDIEPQRPSHLSESPIFTRYVHVSNTSQSFNSAQKRLGHLPGTEFCMHDILSSEPLRIESDAKFDMIILKTSAASTRVFATLLDGLRELSTDNGFLMVVQPDDFEERQGSSSDESLVNISWNFTDTTFILQAAHLPIHLRATDESASRDGALHVIFASLHPSRNDVRPAANTPIVVFSPNVPELIVLRKTLRQLGWTGRVIDPAKAVHLPENMPLVLLDSPTASFLDGIAEGDWDTLKALLKPGRQLLYVTSGSQRLVTAPSNALFHGLARTIRGEDPSIKIKTLDVTSLWDWNAAEAIYSAIGTFSNASEDQEMEYCERSGVVSISRLLSDDALIKTDESGRHNNELQSKFLHGNPRTVRFRCERIGAMDSLTYYEVSDQPLPLRENCIEIEMHAASLNFKDIATSMGLVPEDEYQLGLEGSGMVTRVGRNVKIRHVGQRVLVYSRGSFANRVQAEPQRTLVLPDDMSFEAAATLCSVYFTVLYAFAHVMQLRKGQSVLLHSATGGVGIASIHFCRYIGAEIYATAGSEEKRKHLTDQYGIPPECIFSSRSTGFGSAIMKATHGRGVDVVLNFLTGDLLDESWRCLAPGGVLLEIGKKDIVDRNQLSMEPFNRNCSYRAIDVSHPSIDQDLELTARILGDMMHHLKAGHIQPIEPVKVFSFAKIPEAMRYMRSGAHMGKIVISDGSKDDIDVQTRPATRTLRLDPSGAYLIIGGLKGLCGSLAILLAQSGAKQLVVMSRSGADDHKSRAVLRDIIALGAHLTVFKGDVSCAEDVSRMFQQARRPIKGIIHGAMVLRDKTYEAMTSEDFHTVIESKHRGTWNLHEVAQRQPSPLEFFTLLSSISGVIGHAGQANYAAGNVFQDAFAAYRQGLGLRCHSVNLGIIEDVGYMSNNQEVAQRAEARGAFTGIDERTLLKIARLSILQQMDMINPQSASQMITGLPVPLPSDSPLLADARFSSLVAAQSTTSGSHAGASTNNTAAAFNQMVKMKTDRSGLLREAVRLVNAQLVKNLGMADDMEPGKSLSTYGIDSLAAVDLRNWLRVQLKAELTTLDILNASSLLVLCEKVVANVLADIGN